MMQTIDLVVLISKAIDAGHDITIEHDGVVVHIKPAAAPKQKPEPIKPNMTVQELTEAVEKGERMKRRKAVNRKELDMGKVKALRDAGWSLEKIADEMGCAPQTIANHLKEVES